ncbi:hypothetical protein [Solibacillus sp. FSL H8-0538]|uniref:hypothetical protein n=1 Tax=Solibacillus sp. FSL H8-0538 TaxID=2921400 RepID=UPI0030F81D19
MNSRDGFKRTVEKYQKQKELREPLAQENLTSTTEPNVEEQPKRRVIKIKSKSEETTLEKVIPHTQELLEASEKAVNFPNDARRPPKKATSFEESHKRFTNYVKKDYYQIIQRLRIRDDIESMTALLNDAIH